ncbi:hypothetical protein DFQ28_009002 [Apophysomyces sp. BC1034]|nr:hypothetical protein DFQ30_008640 [Apophysomyces sp. BC1015]KAG0185672.1 hypothetical protein DFQ28_009002 [Apophysomyces sp. BC1034]
MLTLLFGYILIATLFFVEVRYESSRTTTALQTAADDRGTTRLLILTSLAAFLSPLWILLDIGSAPEWIGFIGLAWIVGGIVLLRWTTSVNPFYLRAMATTDDHYICTDGPYKVVRHPGYVAFLLAWFGFGLATANWMALLTVAILSLYAYVRRIQAEEQMMLDRFGVDYQQYVGETFR